MSPSKQISLSNRQEKPRSPRRSPASPQHAAPCPAYPLATLPDLHELTSVSQETGAGTDPQTYLGTMEPRQGLSSVYLKAAHSTPFHIPLLLGVSVRPQLQSRGLGPCGSSGIHRRGEEVSGTTSGTQPRSRCPGTRSRCPGKARRQGCCGGGGRSQAWQGGSGGSRAGCSVLLCHAASQPPPASVWRAPPHPCVRSPTSSALPGCPAQPPAYSVCFLSHFAKYLLIFSTKSQRLPRGARVSTHYSRKCAQLPALTNNPTTNRKGHTNKHQQSWWQPCSCSTRAALP